MHENYTIKMRHCSFLTHYYLHCHFQSFYPVYVTAYYTVHTVHTVHIIYLHGTG